MAIDETCLVERRAGDLLLVDERLVRPGDVLLVLGGKAHSKAIASATGGPVSHAAVFQQEWVLIESLRKDGVARTPLRVGRVEEKRGYALFSHLAGVKQAVIARPPGLETLYAEGLLLAGLVLEKATQPYLGLDYPNLLRLGEALPKGSALRTLYCACKRVERDRAIRSRGFDGPFCSALVVDILGRLGVALFDPAVVSSEISPNALLNTALEPVPGAVVSLRPDDERHAEEIEAMNARRKAIFDRNRDFQLHSLSRRNTAHAEQLAEELRSSALEVRDLLERLAGSAGAAGGTKRRDGYP